MDDTTYETKIREFALTVAKRHRGRPLDRASLVAALRGYHRSLALFNAVPPLDARAVGLAVGTYDMARSPRRRSVA